MRFVIRPDYESASRWVADYVVRRIAQFDPTPDRPFVLGLPTGSTPTGIYRELVAAHRAGRVSFEHVVTFNMDEYVGLPETHPESYHAYMRANLFDHVDIHPHNVHILDGNAPDLERECREYEDAIAAVGGVELFLAGIGPDGHIAFNEPGSSLTSRTRVKTLARDTIAANARFFENDMSRVPTMALTVGVGTVMDAREVLLVATGLNKAYALSMAIENGINHMWTCSAIQMHPRALIVCDAAATAELKVKTVEYFKGLEERNEAVFAAYRPPYSPKPKN